MEKKPIDYQKVNPVIHYLMISSLMIIFLTLLISWFLWFFLYHNIVESMLISFNFKNFSIITLLFAGFSLVFALSLIFLTNKNIYNNFISLLSFILALVVIMVNLFFYSNFKVNNFLVVFLPWIITIVATALLFVTSGTNLVIIKNDFNEKQQARNLIINQPKNDEVLIKHSLPNQATINNQELLSSEQRNFKLDDQENVSLSDRVGENFTDLTVVLENNKLDKILTGAKNKVQTEETITNWTKKQIKQIWETADVIPGVNKDLYRKDYAGAWMFFSAFIASPTKEINHNIRSYSWTIVRHKPLSQNGTNAADNLRAMNVINALTKGENYPKWKTKISSRGNENIIKEQIWSD